MRTRGSSQVKRPGRETEHLQPWRQVFRQEIRKEIIPHFSHYFMAWRGTMCFWVEVFWVVTPCLWVKGRDPQYESSAALLWYSEMLHLIGTIVKGGNTAVCLQGENSEYFEKNGYWYAVYVLCPVSTTASFRAMYQVRLKNETAL